MLSCGHSSLTLYIQLYLSGYGLTLDDLERYRTWGSLTPGHPEHGHTAGVEITTGPLGQGIAQRGRHGDGRPPRARPARPGRGARHQPVRPPHLRIRLRRRHRGGHHPRGLLAGRPPAARQPDRALRRQHISIEDDTERSPSPRTCCARYEAYGWHVQRVTWRSADGYHEDVAGPDRRSPAARDHTRPAVVHRAAHDHRLARAERAEHRRGARLGARRRRGRRDQAHPAASTRT